MERERKKGTQVVIIFDRASCQDDDDFFQQPESIKYDPQKCAYNFPLKTANSAIEDDHYVFIVIRFIS